MYKFNNQHTKRVFVFIGIFLLFSVIGLWSFNTLSGLFDGPQAEYKHVLAFFGLALGARFCFSGGFRHHARSHECVQS